MHMWINAMRQFPLITSPFTATVVVNSIILIVLLAPFLAGCNAGEQHADQPESPDNPNQQPAIQDELPTISATPSALPPTAVLAPTLSPTVETYASLTPVFTPDTIGGEYGTEDLSAIQSLRNEILRLEATPGTNLRETVNKGRAFMEIIGGSVEYDQETYGEGMFVMLSPAPGYEGGLIFFSFDGAEQALQEAGITGSAIDDFQILEFSGMPGYEAPDGSIVHISPETGQWEVISALGMIRTTEQGAQEISIGNNQWLEAPNKFEPQYLQVSADGIRYYAPGLKLRPNAEGNGWMVDIDAPVLPNTMDFLFGMNGELRFNQEVAPEQYQRTILAFVNSPINTEYRQNIFGSTNPIAFDQLPVVATPSGNQRLIPIFDAQGNEHWPNILINNTTSVYLKHHTLVDYLEPNTIAAIRGNQGIDVTGIKVVVARTYDWQENVMGVRDYLSREVDGPSNGFGVPHALYGFGIGRRGEMIVYAYSKQLTPRGMLATAKPHQEVQLGGVMTDEINPYIVTAHLASIVKAYSLVPTGRVMPLNPEPTGNIGVTQDDIYTYVPIGLFE